MSWDHWVIVCIQCVVVYYKFDRPLISSRVERQIRMAEETARLAWSHENEHALHSFHTIEAHGTEICPQIFPGLGLLDDKFPLICEPCNKKHVTVRLPFFVIFFCHNMWNSIVHTHLHYHIQQLKLKPSAFPLCMKSLIILQGCRSLCLLSCHLGHDVFWTTESTNQA